MGEDRKRFCPVCKAEIREADLIKVEDGWDCLYCGELIRPNPPELLTKE